MKREDRPQLPLRITFKDFFRAFGKTILIWTIIALIIIVGLYFDVDRTLIGGVVVIFGLITQAFIGLVGLISLVPLVGPIIAKVLALPVFWLINSLGYFVSIIAIKRGYSKTVMSYRVLTVVLLIGVVIGYILGKLV
jgi:hypothetical protein